MKTALYLLHKTKLTRHSQSDVLEDAHVQLVTCFGAISLLQKENIYDFLRRKFPHAQIILCSTAGEIYNNEVYDDSLSVSATQFDDTPIQSNFVNIKDYKNSFDAGVALLNTFDTEGLKYLLVLSDGGKVNGSELVRGLNVAANDTILITGGLAGDGGLFQSTLVGINTQPSEGIIAAIGFLWRQNYRWTWYTRWLGNIWSRKKCHKSHFQRVI